MPPVHAVRGSGAAPTSSLGGPDYKTGLWFPLVDLGIR